MATNEILQIVVFSLFFGVACAALGERARKLVGGIEELSHVILSITGYIMALAPIARRGDGDSRNTARICSAD